MNIQDIKRMKLRVVLPLWIVGVLLTPGVAMAQETALDRYIAKPDPSYSWRLANTISGHGYKGFVIDLTSQTWRSASEVDRPQWKHWLTIVKPDKVTSNKALLFIGGGASRPTTM
jgi:PhoPQ-activated pathogenicity-related protein